MTDIKFAAIGINHSHIYGQVDCLQEAGAQVRGGEEQGAGVP